MIRGIGKAGRKLHYIEMKGPMASGFTKYNGKNLFMTAMAGANVASIYVDHAALVTLNNDINGVSDRIIGGISRNGKLGDVLSSALAVAGLDAAIAKSEEPGKLDVYIAGEKANIECMRKGGTGIVAVNVKEAEPQSTGDLFMSAHRSTKHTESLLNGMKLVGGVAVGKTYLYYGPFHGIEIKEEKIPADKISVESERFESACKDVTDYNSEKSKQVEGKYGQDSIVAVISRGFNTILNDMKPEVVKMIETEHVNAEFAVQKVFMPVVNELKEGNWDGTKQCEVDYEGVMADLIRCLSGKHPERLKDLVGEDVVLIADQIHPQDALAIKDNVKAIVLQIGGAASHGAIIARKMDIPAIQIDQVMERVTAGQTVIVDGEKGIMLVNPEAQALEDAKSRIKELSIMRVGMIKDMKGQEARLISGERIKLFANISGPEDLNSASIFGVEGVGLYRTDFQMGDLFNRLRSLEGLPPEVLQEIEDQLFGEYLKVAQLIKGLPVIGEEFKRTVDYRTFDWGRDKLYGDAEKSPLGVSGVRVYDFQKILIGLQLRAFLRLSAAAPELVRVMFPFIAGYLDIINSKERIEVAKRDLLQRQLSKHKVLFNNDPTEELISKLEKKGLPMPYYPKMPVGIVVEIPSAAIEMPQLIEDVDFISFGTNDLIQFMRAADRENQKVSSYYRLTVPAVYTVIRDAAKVALDANKGVGICGEMASNLPSVPPLIGMGFRSLSMSQNQIPIVKNLLRKLDLQACKALAAAVVRAKTSEDAKNEVLKKYPELAAGS